MKMIKAPAAIALVTSFALLSPSLTIAADTDTLPTTVVRMDQLRSTSDDFAVKAYVRLRSGSRQVCAPHDGRALRDHENFTACYSQALSDAVRQLNSPSVTSLHMRTKATDAL